MRDFRYLHYDVFTDVPFEGNQLAVFPAPAGLSDVEMQTITREMNFSECTFVFPPERSDTDVRMRIFTPGEELPLAGHPTIGSTFALAHEGVIARERADFTFGLGVGPIGVTLEWKAGRLDFAWMTQPLPQFGPQISDRAAFTAAIGAASSDLAPGLPIEIVSCGVPFLFATLASRAAVDRVAVDRVRYTAVLKAAGLEERPLFIFTPERGGDEGTVYSRMLAPGFGITEDPATGGASGPLGCYLATHGILDRQTLTHCISLQGVAMRRPSRIHIAIDGEGTAITRVRIGGRSVLVGEGAIRF